MGLNMLYLVPDVVHESISVRHFRVCLGVLDGQLAIVGEGASVVIGSVNYLHLSKISRNSGYNIKEN